VQVAHLVLAARAAPARVVAAQTRTGGRLETLEQRWSVLKRIKRHRGLQ
jgi:hypothetical protein